MEESGQAGNTATHHTGCGFGVIVGKMWGVSVVDEICTYW